MTVPRLRPVVSPPKLTPGDRVAIVSPSWAGPGYAPTVHEQAMRRLVEATGVMPVEYPTTRRLDASALDRAADLNAAFGDPSIRGVLATIGGDDQITVIPHLDARLVAADPKPFVGYSDNTNLLSWLWSLGVAGFHGGSTLVHLGAGPGIDDIHLASLRAALFDGGELVLTDPGESEDFGPDWLTPEALTAFGERERTDPWTWAGAARTVSGPTWGGCLEVLDWIALAGRLPSTADLEGGILLLETSEDLPPAAVVGRWVRSLGEAGILSAVEGVVVARPAASSPDLPRTAPERVRFRDEQRDAVLTEISRYNDQAVVCIGVPFGHTRPQWIVPYGGTMRLDGVTRTVTADYS